MLCEICHKNIADIHMTRFVDGRPEQIHICSECAKEQGAMKVGIEVPVGIGEDGPELPFSLDDFFQNFVKNILVNNSFIEESEYRPNYPVSEVPGGKVCPQCNTSIEEYLETGIKGCDKCYPTFRPIIMELLESAMRTNFIPEGNRQKWELARKMEEVMRLKDDLDISVAVEDYESAGAIRDQIEELTKKI